MRQDITFNKTKPKILQKTDQCALCLQYFSHQYELNPLKLKIIIEVALHYDKGNQQLFRLTQKAFDAEQNEVTPMVDISTRCVASMTTSRL